MSSPPQNNAGGWGASSTSNYQSASSLAPPPPLAPPESFPAAPGAPPPMMQSRYGGGGGGGGGGERERHRPKYKERELEASFKDSCRIHLPSKRGALAVGWGGGEGGERRGGRMGGTRGGREDGREELPSLRRADGRASETYIYSMHPVASSRAFFPQSFSQQRSTRSTPSPCLTTPLIRQHTHVNIGQNADGEVVATMSEDDPLQSHTVPLTHTQTQTRILKLMQARTRTAKW